MFPIWIKVQDRLETSKQNYEKKLTKKENIEKKEEINSTDEGQKRYRKEFFNDLDPGEKIIILYSDKTEVEKEVEVTRDMSTWGKFRQKIKLWWANM
jgi:hypothetical protein